MAVLIRVNGDDTKEAGAEFGRDSENQVAIVPERRAGRSDLAKKPGQVRLWQIRPECRWDIRVQRVQIAQP